MVRVARCVVRCALRGVLYALCIVRCALWVVRRVRSCARGWGLACAFGVRVWGCVSACPCARVRSSVGVCLSWWVHWTVRRIVEE